MEGREGTQAAILSISEAFNYSAQCTLTLYNLTLQFAMIHQSPGQRVVQILGADALASSDIRQAEHWAAAGGESEEILSPSHSLAPDIWHLVIRDSGDVVRAGYWVMTPFTHHS